MANNKVQLANGTVLIDLTDSTLSDSSQLLQGVTAYNYSGIKIEGSALPSGSEWTSGIYQDVNGFIRVSPLGGAGGVYKDSDGFLILSETQSGADTYAKITVSSSAPFGGDDGDVWIQQTFLYKKENGVWVQKTDLSDAFASNVKYIRSE